ncbi:DUF3866 family protein [Metallumcola ferriviriculae]|uniref:DUF3866 family protein n=1 Tax=Metallumcola ferriviriculae TaxID=3039180 RepID=A0AAU0US15_9FIRM|nr:DUF3866 family protein [Desulfitibacteraceae bacterium MK1]
MICFSQGEVTAVMGHRPGVTEINIKLELGEAAAINYDLLTGTVAVGDLVLVNTTAVGLGLGSGGCHFVMANINNTGRESLRPGHIIKLRYTPNQVKVLAVEEPASPYYEEFRVSEDLGGMPVVLGLLHSMLPYAAAGIKAADSTLRVAYIMSDGGALPLGFSKMVPSLKHRGFLDGTVTIGHAFGGDLEAVNIYTGLLAARNVLKADVAVVTMGPGITGTGSTFGFSGMEQVSFIDTVDRLGGRPFVIPRLSMADPRPRHRGVSHHTLTVLDMVHSQATVVFPKLEDEWEEIQDDVEVIAQGHKVVEVDGMQAHHLLMKSNLKVNSMGREFEQDPAFFLAAGAAGILAGRRVAKSICGR